MNTYVVRSVTIQPDGTAIEYLRADGDVFPSGLQLQHVVFIPRGADYDTELDAIDDAVQAALMDALQDTETTDPVPLTQLNLSGDDDDDDDDED